MTAKNYQVCLEEFIGHNRNLVRMAQALQVQLQTAVLACGEMLDAAAPEPNFDAAGKEIDPVEYSVPAEEIAELRAVCTLAKVWGLVDLE